MVVTKPVMDNIQATFSILSMTSFLKKWEENVVKSAIWGVIDNSLMSLLINL